MKSVTSCVAFLSLIACGLSIPQAYSQTKLSNTWSSAGQLTQARSGAAAVQMTDGRILITGGTDGNGVPQATAEAYDPGTGVFSALPAMNVPRANHAAVINGNGDVLVTGGLTSGGSYSDSAEIYSMRSHTWTLVPSAMDTGLAGQTMVLLPDGNVLIAGGVSTAKVVSSIVLFNAASQTFTPINSLLTPRQNAAAAAMPDGRVLIVGGADINGAALASTEIFTYSKSTMTGTIAAGPAMTSAREYATATRTYDGVAVIGGNDGKDDLGTAEIFSRWTNKFRVVTGGTPRSHHFAAQLPNNGSVLAIGGTGGAKVDLLEPWANNKAGAFIAAADSLENQDGGIGALAGLGSLLAAGGMGDFASAAELYWFPTVSTDAYEYAPGTPVEMTGTGFQPFETVDLHLHEWVDQSTEDDPDATVTTNSLGDFSYAGYSPTTKDLGAFYHLTAVGTSSGYQAQTVFGDDLASIDFANAALNQATGACGQIIIAATGTAPLGPIYLYTTSGTGTFYSSATCTGTAVTQITAGPSVTLYYKDNTAGTPTLAACSAAAGSGAACNFGQLLGDIYAPQTENIYGAATKLAWSQLPGGGSPGLAWAQQPVILVEDASGAVVGNSVAPVTLTLTTDPGGGLLSCNLNPVNATSGIASFSGCSINLSAATNYCITASSTGLTSTPNPTNTTNGCFSVSGTSAATSTVSASPTTVGADGVSYSTITVTLLNGQSTPESGLTVTLAQNGASSVTTISGVTNASGVATFRGTDTTVQTVKYTATDATDAITVTQTASVSFTTVGTTLTQSPASPNIIPLSTPQVITFTSTLVDTATGNGVSGATVAFTLTGVGGTACSGTTNTSGVATCTYSYAGSATATVLTVGSTFSAATVGSISYAASGAGTPSETITVGGSTPAFAWTTAPPGTAQAYGATFPIAASSTTESFNASISYNVTGGCTLAGTTVTMTSGTTSCVVTANLAGKKIGSTYYNPETLTATVLAKLANPAAITVTGFPTSAAYQTTFDVGTSGGSAADTGAITFTASGACSDVSGGSTILMTAGTGTCSITATQAADTNYNSVTSTPAVTVTATSATATMTINCPTGDIYNGAPQGCTATSTNPSGLTVDFTYGGSPTVPTNAGSYSVVGTIDTTGQSNYSGTSSPVTFVISPEPVTAVAGNLTAVYTGAAQAIGACQFNGSFTANLGCVDNPLTETEVGTGIVSPTVSYNNGDVAGNYTISDQNGTWVITQASSSVTLSCAPGTFVYTGSAITPCVATVTAPGPTLTATIQYANNIYAGTASAVATFAGNTDVTSSSSTLTTFTITQQTALITLTNNSPYAYTGSQVPLTATTTPTGLAYTITYAGISPTVYPLTTVPPILPGSYTVVATIMDLNYSGTATGTEVISPIAAPMTLTLDQSSSNPSVYGTPVAFDLNVNNGAATCPTGTVQLWVNGSKSGAAIPLPVDCGSSVFFQVADLPVGQNSIYATYSGDANYPSAQSVTLTQTVNADGTSMTLTTTGTIVNVGQSVTFTATITLAASINGTATVPDGTVSFYQCTSPAATCDGSNGTELGTPQAISGITSNTASSALTTSLTAEGSYVIGAVYTPTVSDLDYTGSSAILAETVTVNPDAPIIAWPYPTAIVYGTQLSATQLDATAGYPTAADTIPGTFAYTPDTGVVLDAGNQVLNVTFTPSDLTTYSVQKSQQNLTVLPATLTVTPDPQTMVFGAAIPTFTYQIAGYVNGDTSSVVTGAPECTTTATSTSPAGNYPITCSVGTLAAANYAFTFVAGQLTITAGTSLTITTLPTASNITYTQTLASSVLTGGVAKYNGATVAGTFAWTTPGTVPVAGTAPYGVTFTATDVSDYNTATGNVSVTVLLATPAVTAWPTAANIEVGQALSTSALTGGTATYNGNPVQGTFAWTTPATVPATGTTPESVTFTPNDVADYNTVAGTVSITANTLKTPTITTLPTATAITYGQALSASTLSGGVASVAGTFAWTNPTSIPGAGADPESITFTPSDTTDYNTVAGSVTVTVNKATPTVTTLPTASAISVGQTLVSSTLTGGVASAGSTPVPGSFAWATPATAPPLGADPENVIFTPTDGVDYNTVTVSVTVTVNSKTTPTFSTLPTASAITYGQTLASSVLTGGAASAGGTPVAGTFAWTNPTTAPIAGADPESVTFTPTNTTLYNTAADTVTVTVNEATPTVTTLPTASSLSVGQALSASTLTGGAASVGGTAVPGTFAWTTPTIIPVAGADLESVTFTPTDATDYKTVTVTVSVTVGNKITPTVTAWPTAGTIVYGQTLASSVLTGGAASAGGTAVPGTFAWTNPTTAPLAGADPESVTFTPTDTTVYNTVAGTVTVTVSKVTPTVTAWPTASAIAPGKTLASSTLAGGTASYNGTTVPGTFAWTTPTTTPAAGTDVESVTFTPTDATDYNTVIGTVTVTVNNKTTPTVTVWPTASAITYGQTLASSTLTGGTASVAGTFAWTTPTTAPTTGADAESVTFTPTDTTDYNPAVGSVTVTVSKATPTVTTLPTAGALAVGQALSASTLTGGAASAGGTAVPGTFAWTTPATVPVAGADPESVTFTPTDATDYNMVTVTVTVRVGNKITPTVTAWPTAGVIYVGQTLASSVLTGGTASVAGTFAWTTPTTVPPAGTNAEGVTFTPTDTTDYNTVAGSVKVTVSSATGRVLTVSANDVSRVYGTANPAFTGSVTGAVNGDTFTESFSTVATISSNVGTYPIVPSVKGTNLADYVVTTRNGSLTITQADTKTSVSPSSSSVNPGQSVTLTAKVVSATTGTPTGSVSFYEGTSLLGTGTLASGTATFSTSSLTAGTTNTIEAVYGGDDNFITSFGSTSVSEASLDFTLAISGAASVNVNQGSAATYQIAVKPLYGSYPGPVTFTSVGAPSTSTVTFSPATVAANGGSTTVTLTITTSGSANLAPGDTGSKRSPLAWALLLIPLLGLSRLRRQGRRLSRLATLLLLLGCTLVGAMVTGCGGSVNLIEHDYSIVVTATSGNVIHNVPVTLDVK